MAIPMAIEDYAFGIVPIWRQPEADQFLLVQHQAGHWGFPKGHAEAEETAMAAACREFSEETGICDYQVMATPAFSETYQLCKHQQTFEKTVTYFIGFVRFAAVSPQAKEIQNYAWLPFEAAWHQLTFPQSKQVLEQVDQFLRSTQNKGPG